MPGALRQYVGLKYFAQKRSVYTVFQRIIRYRFNSVDNSKEIQVFNLISLAFENDTYIISSTAAL